MKVGNTTVQIVQPYIAGITYYVCGRVDTGVSLVAGVSEQDAQEQALRVARDVLPDSTRYDTPIVDVMDRTLILYNTTTERYYRCIVTIEPVSAEEASSLHH